MKTAKQIRQDFLEFFQKEGHEFVKSAPVVPQDDPTLMFTNAGMNQFKDVFLNQGTRNYSRAVNSQKCIRVSGKHNDLEEVGKDGYHHTFFEMLGNWSFGDYSKKDACLFAWNLLTKVWNLDPRRLYITVFKDDNQTAKIWEEITSFSEQDGKIQRHGAKDNFWEMGAVGPCGPCTEIHYDKTQDFSGKDLVNKDSEDVIEIWNIVFIQHNRKEDSSLEDLPKMHVDTGMGFERITAILQQKNNNYQTDLFLPIIDKIKSLCSLKEYTKEQEIALQVIADHIRMICFSIADGVKPSNIDRGYVVRRVLRRALRFGKKLNLDDVFLADLVETLSEMYRDIFPEIYEQRQFIYEVIKAEEISFQRTLDRGLKLFASLVEKSKNNLSSNDVFVLYDTYGFPLDLTCQMAEEHNLTINFEEVNQLLEQAKELSRSKQQNITSDWQVLHDETSSFVGYDYEEVQSYITRYRITDIKHNKQKVVQLMLKENPFYAESGGQVGDIGKIYNDEFSLEVFDCQKIDSQHVCFAIIQSGNITANKITASINSDNRNNIKKHHTATHILHQALKDILGEHVQQKGSQVTSSSLRFDFSHFKALSKEELSKVEQLANEQVLANNDVFCKIMDIKEAKSKGAAALFGEKYQDEVRVINVGEYSMELCGGTHVASSGQIGFIKITSEQSISTGVRRIEACCGMNAYKIAFQQQSLLEDLSLQLKCKQEQLNEKLTTLLQKQKALQKDNEKIAQQLLQYKVRELIKDGHKHDDITIINAKIDVSDMKALKTCAFQIAQQLSSFAIVVGAIINNKAMLVCHISKDLIEKNFQANKLIQEIAKKIDGSGGGQAGMAQAGGSNTKIDEAIVFAKEYLTEKL